MKIVDLSTELYHEKPASPGEPPTGFIAVNTVARYGWALTQIVLSTHMGTHMDAPAHFLEAGLTIDEIPLSQALGPARVLRIPKQRGEEISVEELNRYGSVIEPGSRILIETGWSRLIGRTEYFEGFPGLSPAAARFLAERRIALLGLDIPSPHPTEYKIVHETLFGAGIVILEELVNLAQLPDQPFLLIALPLRLKGLDGSPLRAVAIVDAELRALPKGPE